MKSNSIFKNLKYVEAPPSGASGIAKCRAKVIDGLRKQLDLFDPEHEIKLRGRGKWFKFSGDDVFLAMYYRNIRLEFRENGAQFIKLTKTEFVESVEAMIAAIETGDIDEELKSAEDAANKKKAEKPKLDEEPDDEV